MSAAVLVMAKAARAGGAKTRLEPLLGHAGCASLQAALIRRAVGWGEQVAPGAVHLAHSPVDAAAEMRALVGPGVRLLEQPHADLGAALAEATGRVLEESGGPLIVIGTDLPTLRFEHGAAALRALEGGHDVCFGPAVDGGYYLVALPRALPELFALESGSWGGAEVLERSLAAARESGLRPALLGKERDLDDPADAAALLADPALPGDIAELLRRPGVTGPLVSVVIAARDEAHELPVLLDHLAGLPGRFEVVLADGGSVDATRTIARQHPLGAKVIETAGGRAVALNAGARVSKGELIVFLHADSRLPHGAYSALAATARGRSTVVGGNFALRFDGGDLFAALLGAVYAVQRRLGLYYGDSSIWVRRETFERLGGYRELAIMDDYDFVRRLERLGPTACLPGPALTSSRRWRALGIPRTVLSWVLIRWLYLAGVDPDRLARLYPRVRRER